MSAAPAPAGKLVLEDGAAFEGRSLGFPRSVAGEVVFNTGMVGYTESLTDPSYAGQILVLTYPLVGNYGVPEHFESARIQASALVVSELALEYSHAAARKSLPQWLREQRIPCLAGIDTRALTKRLRARGCMLGKVLVGSEQVHSIDADVSSVSSERKIFKGGEKTVLLVDCGAKGSIVSKLTARGLTVVSVPWDHDFSREAYDGLVVSNGPGNPTACGATIENLKKAMAEDKPILGICLGHQLLALAAGAWTYKLKYGHRGHNQPCIEVGGDKQRCYITSQNHGYAVDEGSLPSGWHAWFRNANDGSNEGMRHATRPFMSVQFHPEAAPGPVDCEYLFDRFTALMR
ncbi:MAG TPA: glutamine-hydrolyzing carbamoyl-phosphate synthase small subunit [Burkholderiales bacterium]|jgi:carbamoyl-phosphate synthase small subunit|nr:glutamine-hydrolyzing carbamoyl-phosphate synthase small subunit [Burkholderiales bacterium]